jgi:DNA polymerase III subunit gamma/tau
MSYQVLARKYRPRSFNTLVGQEHVVRALTHALEQKRLHHAYLFTGTRGVGKTTLSRILAKSLNCETGITATPCGVCDACTAIDAGRFVDYIEMDAASNRGVDEMAQLLEQAVYAPSNARFKVYMIDEVHMLTNHAFNSMLKTLEEPPEHVKFILATTDPQKIPVTVLSRCLQFNLKQMPPGHIVGHLDNILGQEGIAFDTPALRLLAAGAHGSMRDALSLTDQAIAYAAGKVTLEAVQGMLGALDQSYLVRVLDALAAKDGAGLLAVADEMATRSLSYSAALQDLGTLLHRIALAQTVPAAVPDDLPERDDILRLSGLFDAEEVQLFYQIAVHGRNELSLAPDEYAGFSMTLLRMLAFRPGVGGAEAKPVVQMQAPAAAPARTAAPQAAAASVTVASAAPAARAPGGISPARAALEAARNAGKPQPAAQPSRSMPPAPPPWDDEIPPAREQAAPDFSGAAAQKKTESRPDSRTESRADLDDAVAVIEAPAAVQQAPRAKPLPVTPVPALGWDGNWPALAAALSLRGVAQQLAQQSELLQCETNGEGVQIKLRIPLETLRSAGSVEKLAATLSEHFGKVVRVETEIGVVEQTANARAVADREERLRQAEQNLQSDPFVQTMMREFGATIVPGSIKPV